MGGSKPIPIKIRVYSYVHNVRVWEGLPGNSLCGRRCVYVNIMCMCAYTAYVTQLSTEVCRPRSPKCSLPLGQLSCGDRLREGGRERPWAKLPGFLERVHVCAIILGEFPCTHLIRGKHLQPLQKASIIHSISVKWFADRGVCLLSFLPICARTLQLWQGQVRCMD